MKEFLHGCCRRRAGEIVSRDGVFTAQTNGLVELLRQFALPIDLAFRRHQWNEEAHGVVENWKSLFRMVEGDF